MKLKLRHVSPFFALGMLSAAGCAAHGEVVVEHPRHEVVVVEKPHAEVIVERPRAEVIVEKPRAEVVVAAPAVHAEVVVEKPRAEVVVTAPAVHAEVVVEKPRAEIVVAAEPPAPKEVIVVVDEKHRPHRPSAEHIWVEGYHRWVGDHYVLEAAHWELAPHGKHWVKGHWAPHAKGRVWVDAHFE